ncbi:hypothetical protein OJ997_24240 [Solirubrobacter phytolaccae]|uniref:DUF7144 domain-containing protein n=1 Tax=Solirubrobacter phytolaccae TaxID=1404360 RepID=A0A9X3SBB3_9ACTN|nr:hypothetical protein [Solirubrobacter phytolaccae]MDA0183441.1 hypothetical protein [Solirubrobacter phytolaccae]
MSAQPSSSRGQDWAAFVVCLFFVLGCFNLIDGLAALVQDDYFRADELLFGDLAMWGALYLVVGALQLLAAWLIYRANDFGPALGAILALLNAVVALMSLGAYPIWSVMILVLDGLVIYALIVHGTGRATA